MPEVTGLIQHLIMVPVEVEALLKLELMEHQQQEGKVEMAQLHLLAVLV
jgi:hypothetical protein